MGFERRLKELEDKIESLQNMVEKQAELIKQRYPTPALDNATDLALVEAIFDILSRPRGKDKLPIATQEEIRHYLDMYPAFWGAILNILIDKGITTQKELDCEILAYHYMLRTEGLNTEKTKEELFKIRREYAKELMTRKNPYEMIGR